jgi:hypothetical protein
MTTVAHFFGCDNYANVGGFIAGVECEIEGVRHPEPVGFFNPVPDGSLRNHGIEYVSAPLPTGDLVKGFEKLHGSLTFYQGEEPFSIRTSTHVHINCQTLDLVQARTLVLLYALFEEYFFLMVKPERRDNIHCVPLTETAVPNLYKRDLPKMVENWHKYTALNLKRLKDLGTMEFRHLHGTNDSVEFAVWVNTLENMWKLCQRTTISKETLTKENIKWWFDTVFANSERAYSMRHSLFDLIRNSVIDVKFSI